MQDTEKSDYEVAKNIVKAYVKDAYNKTQKATKELIKKADDKLKNPDLQKNVQEYTVKIS